MRQEIIAVLKGSYWVEVRWGHHRRGGSPLLGIMYLKQLNPGEVVNPFHSY